MRRPSMATARQPGLATSGEIEAVRLVGPNAPATKRGLPSSASARLAALRASRAPSRFNSYARFDMSKSASAIEVAVNILEPVAAECRCILFNPLDHRTLGAVEHQNACAGEGAEFVGG